MNRHQRMVQRKLQSGRLIDRKILEISERIASLISQATAMNVNLSDMPGNPNRNIHKMEDVVVHICDMKADAEHELNRLLSVQKELYSYIDQVSDHYGRIVLERRYIRAESWEAIAKEIGYSIRSAQRIHDKALDEIQIE